MPNTAELAAPSTDIELAREALQLRINDSISWYTKNAKTRGRESRILRVAMIITGGLTVILPLLTTVDWMTPFRVIGHVFSYTCISSIPTLHTAPWLGSLAAACTGLMLAYEKYYGHSEAWMRFIVAEQELRHLANRFSLNWLALKQQSAENSQFIKELQDIENAHSTIEKNETNKWVGSFKNALTETTPP